MARVIISVADDRLSSLSSVAAELSQHGMTVEQTLAEVGAIVGSVDDARMSEVRAVPGVAHVEIEGTYQLPPPDSPVQ